MGMATAHLLRDPNDQLVRARKHDSYKANRKLRESSLRRESIAVGHKGLWTWDPGKGRTELTFSKNQLLFSQGEAADAVFYLQVGRVKLTVVSAQGKEAVVSILERGSFLGESCLAGQTVRAMTATAMEDSTLLRIGKDTMIRVLDKEPRFAELFMSYLLAHHIRLQEDLVDQLFNCSEKRLARILLLLAHFRKEGKPEAVIPKISQETLAEMVGTTRSRVSFFMNKFRKLGCIDYDGNGKGGLRVRRSLPNIVFHDFVPPSCSARGQRRCNFAPRKNGSDSSYFDRTIIGL